MAKELVLNTIALLVAVLLVARRRSLSFDLVDGLLALFLLWSAASALFATNYWLAQRSLGVSVSSAVIFWGARSVAERGSYRPILVAVAIATVIAAALALAQAYGLETEYFSANRAPGGTFGNRNFVAHIAVIGLPSLVWCTVTARRPFGALLGSLGAAVVAAALVLSRSRAAWLAVAASVIILLVPILASIRYWRGGKIGGRFARFTLAAVIGGLASIALPNTLNWNSESPYLDSARAVVDYKKGSGRGRVAQYKNSLNMALSNPALGVGPGNWSVEYRRFAPANDRSIAADGMTANPWPSSDWVAFMSERGFVPTLALLGVFAMLFLRSLRRWSELKDTDAVLAQCVLAGNHRRDDGGERPRRRAPSRGAILHRVERTRRHEWNTRHRWNAPHPGGEDLAKKTLARGGRNSRHRACLGRAECDPDDGDGGGWPRAADAGLGNRRSVGSG